MSTARSILRLLARVLRAGLRVWSTWISRARIRIFVIRARVGARIVSARVSVDVARDATIGRRVRVQIDPGTRNRLVIGPQTRVRDDVLFWLRGGSIEVGARSEIRRLCSMNSSGRLRIGSRVIVSFGVCLGCAESLTIEDLAAIGEYSTITDSRHPRTAGDRELVSGVRTAPTRVGRSVWIGAHAVVASGVDVGDYAFVGGGSVVTRDVPAWWLAVGVPARPIRRLEPESPGDEDPPAG